MILEVAVIKIRAGEGEKFAQVFHQAEKVLTQAKGYVSHELRPCIETPNRYLLLVRWETLEAHTVGFRGSPLFQQWRAVIGPLFDGAPEVEHYDEALTGSRL